jgi:hypothetical protein
LDGSHNSDVPTTDRSEAIIMPSTPSGGKRKSKLAAKEISTAEKMAGKHTHS